MGSWTLEDIPWEEFNPARVDPDIIPLIKAASLVEFNSGDYRTYLNNVFHDDPRIQRAVDGWADEEIQHGVALGRWAALADPSFDFDASFKRFTDGFALELDVDHSVRGSRTGELIARCMVETGTSSYYSALAEATDEPVLKAICQRIAADEVSHYWLFFNYMKRYLADEDLSFWRRLRVAAERIFEAEDDELAYAYYAANVDPAVAYDRRRNAAAYASGAVIYYTPNQVTGVVSMLLAALGLKSDGWLGRSLTTLACRVLRMRQRMIARSVAFATA